MGPRDHLRVLQGGIDCTVCEARVPADRIRLLARRDDLLFLQIDCAACRSTALGFVEDPDAGDAPGPEAAEIARPAEAPPVTADDVLDMHGFLEGWDGDLADLLGASGPAGEPASGPSGIGGSPRPRRSEAR
ncbi:MAG: hypothetical protein ABIV26_00740 [Candidatus Limnocylindrales bacterium]